MFFWNKFCGLIVIFFISATSLYAQNSIDFKVKNNVLSKENNLLLKYQSIPFDTVHFRSPMITNSRQPISPDFAICGYGFFCREELKIEKATKLPIRLRLGSLQQCNYYEGKP